MVALESKNHRLDFYGTLEQIEKALDIASMWSSQQSAEVSGVSDAERLYRTNRSIYGAKELIYRLAHDAHIKDLVLEAESREADAEAMRVAERSTRAWLAVAVGSVITIGGLALATWYRNLVHLGLSAVFTEGMVAALVVHAITYKNRGWTNFNIGEWLLKGIKWGALGLGTFLLVMVIWLMVGVNF